MRVDNIVLSQTEFPPSIKNKLARAVCLSSVAVEPLYTIFVWQLTILSVAEVVKIFDGEVNSVTKNCITYITIPFAIANLLADILSVDPLREADEITMPGEKLESKKLELKKLILGYFIKSLAVTIPYAVAGSADSIPVGSFLKSSASGFLGDILSYTSLVFLSFLGVVYYIMFMNDRIQKHVNEFIDLLKNPVLFLNNLKKNPGKYLEAWIQCLLDAFYRGITYSYIIGEVGTVIFNIDKNKTPCRIASIVTGGITFFIALFSRFLVARDKFLNPKFVFVTKQEIDKVREFNRDFIYDILLSAIRGLTLGFLAYELIPSSHALKYIASGIIASLATAQSLYVRIEAKLYEKALMLCNKDDRPINEETPLISKDNFLENTGKVFDELASSFKTSKSILAIDIINLMARLIRFFAFFILVETINQSILNNKLSMPCVVALTFLWGAEVLKNEAGIYKESMLNTCQGLAAKWQLEKEAKDVAKISCFSGSFFRPARVVFKSVYDYPSSLVEKVARQQANVEKVSKQQANHQYEMVA